MSQLAHMGPLAWEERSDPAGLLGLRAVVVRMPVAVLADQDHLLQLRITAGVRPFLILQQQEEV